MIDVLPRDDAFQENVDVDVSLRIDVMIKDVRPLVLECHSLEQAHINVETYLEELQNNESEIGWDSDEDSNEDSNEASHEDSDI